MKAILSALAYGMKKMATGLIRLVRRAVTGSKEKVVTFAKTTGKREAHELYGRYKSIMIDWVIFTLFEKAAKHCMNKIADGMEELGQKPTYDDCDRLFETPVEKVFRIRKLIDNTTA